MGDAVFPLPPRRTDPPEAEFQALYGRWQPLVPREVARLLRAATFPWWVGGGWAVDAAFPWWVGGGWAVDAAS